MKVYICNLILDNIMEIAYLMVGKRFQAKDRADLDQQLAQYKLKTNSDDVFEGVGRLADVQIKYQVQQSHLQSF